MWRAAPAPKAPCRLALGKLIALAEAYPDLKASGNFLELQQQLSALEDELQMARRYYNGATRNLNTLVQSFPSNLIAGMFGFSRTQLFSSLRTPRSAPCRRSRFRVRRVRAMTGSRVSIGFAARPCRCARERRPRIARPKSSIVSSSTVQVAKDGELTVAESIRVRAEGRAIRHGIFRDFPLTFKDAGGTLHEVTFSLLDVSRDGKPRAAITPSAGTAPSASMPATRTRIVPRGDHTYVFRYRTGRQIRWFDGKPELNWNVTGNFWNFPIEAAQLQPELPDGARPVRWTAYTGRLGERGTTWRGSIGTDGVLTVETTRPLAPGEGLTVVAAIPEGAVDPPSARRPCCGTSFSMPAAGSSAGIGFVLVLGYYLVAWRAVGRDPRGGTIIPLFHPPPGISPALANYIHDWGLGRDKWRAFTAAILSLAVRGLVRSSKRGDTLTLDRHRQATGRRRRQAATRRARHLQLCQRAAAKPSSTRTTLHRSLRSIRVSRPASKAKTRIGSSAAISAT